MFEMISIPSILALFMPLPAVLDTSATAPRASRRRRAVREMHLSSYILKDVGLDDFDTLARDQRWMQRPDLER